MATYEELFDLGAKNSPLRNRVAVACIIAAEAIRVELDTVENHAERLVWAASVFSNPLTPAQRMLWALLAADSGLTVPELEGATDAAIQTRVDAAVDLFAVSG